MTTVFSTKPFMSPTGANRLLTKVQSLALGLLAWAAFSAPVEALQVRVRPDNPRIGDTLSVVVELDNPAVGDSPTVKMGENTYPTFMVGPNRFRALLPSTPLDRPGRLVFQVFGEGEVRNIAVWMSDRQTFVSARL